MFINKAGANFCEIILWPCYNNYRVFSQYVNKRCVHFTETIILPECVCSSCHPFLEVLRQKSEESESRA